MKGEGEILVQEEKSICTVVINRPEKRNSLTAQCLDRIRDVFVELAGEDRIRAVVIRGSGTQAFSAGFDISSLPRREAGQRGGSEQTASPLEEALRSMEGFPFPVIAMINGYAYGGGCELAVGCDIRIAARSIKMGMPPARLGLVYPAPGFLRFLRVVGFSRTLEMFLSATIYDSEACLRMGLLNRVVGDDELEEVTYGLAEQMAQHAPLALKGTKRALYTLATRAIGRKVSEELHNLFQESLNSEDLAEAQRAFAEKRRPCFTGR